MYGTGRALQVLAMVDCGVALIVGILNPAAYAVQLVILGSAVLLFGLGHRLEKKAQAPAIGGGRSCPHPPDEEDRNQPTRRHGREDPEPAVGNRER